MFDSCHTPRVAFKADGHTYEMPRNWGDPDATLQQKDFFRIMEMCLEKLPAKTARIFMTLSVMVISCTSTLAAFGIDPPTRRSGCSPVLGIFR